MGIKIKANYRNVAANGPFKEKSLSILDLTDQFTKNGVCSVKKTREKIRKGEITISKFPFYLLSTSNRAYFKISTKWEKLRKNETIDLVTSAPKVKAIGMERNWIASKVKSTRMERNRRVPKLKAMPMPMELDWRPPNGLPDLTSENVCSVQGIIDAIKKGENYPPEFHIKSTRK